MKKNLFVLLLTIAICAGCASHYDITLNNGTVLTSQGKPHLDKDKGSYLFTDAEGKPDSVSVLRVRQISPHSMKAQKGSQFIQ
jgi:uncharacterized protein YcfL